MPYSIWFCNTCGEQFRSEGEAVGCEEHHTGVKEVIENRYSAGDVYSTYPHKILVKMNDGVELLYEIQDDI